MTSIEKWLVNLNSNMALNPRFIEYFQTTFFSDKPEELRAFLASLEQWIPRTIRIKPGQEIAVKKRLEAYGFILRDTYIENVFALDRALDFDPLERRIGYTTDHLVGNFYIQELAAATAVEVLSNPKFAQIQRDLHAEWVPEWVVSQNTMNEDTEREMQRSSISENFVILDMAASPGGKTTQLSEMYPLSFIVANEPTRERIPQLLQNLDRMGSTNIGVTLYPGQYFRHTPETFDRILLDAPCSGEGTLYKGTDATKHWHIKNIKTIARLQEKLLDAAIIALKVWWEMVYSTCSMNLIENEWVLEAIQKKYPGAFDIMYQKHFWPHIDHTGGFFVAKIRKLEHIDIEESTRNVSINSDIKTYKWHTLGAKIHDDITLYEHTGKILAVKKHPHIHELLKKYYFMRLGERIAMIENGEVRFDPFALRYIDTADLHRYELRDEIELDRYLRGELLETNGSDSTVIVRYNGVDIALEEISDTILSNQFPHDWRRK